jgi:hypothetical protein
MFYLQSGGENGPSASADGIAGTTGEAGAAAETKPAALDPLAQMREKLAAAQASGGVKYQVLRDDIQAPAAAPDASNATPQASPTPAVQTLPIPLEKELTELQGRLWASCYRDDNLAVYACIRAKNMKKQVLRIELRCERVAKDGEPISAVSLKLPAGVSALEADASGSVSLVPAELQERSPKVKINLGLSFFVLPTSSALDCEIHYAKGATLSGKMTLALPATCTFAPCPMNADDVAEYMSQKSADLIGVPQMVALSLPGKTSEQAAEALPVIMGQCAGLCHFHGIQHTASAKGTKFLLVAQPPLGNAAAAAAGREALPEGSRVISLVAGAPREGGLDLRITVKSERKDVSEDVGVHLVSIFKELTEGRLRAA